MCLERQEKGMGKVWSGLPDRYKRKYRKSLVILLVGAVCALIGFGYRILATRVPDRIILIANREEKFDFGLPLEAEVQLGEVSQAGTFFFNNQKLTQDELHINLNDSFSVQGNETGSYSVVVHQLIQTKSKTDCRCLFSELCHQRIVTTAGYNRITGSVGIGAEGSTGIIVILT